MVLRLLNQLGALRARRVAGIDETENRGQRGQQHAQRHGGAATYVRFGTQPDIRLLEAAADQDGTAKGDRRRALRVAVQAKVQMLVLQADRAFSGESPRRRYPARRCAVSSDRP